MQFSRRVSLQAIILATTAEHLRLFYSLRPYLNRSLPTPKILLNHPNKVEILYPPTPILLKKGRFCKG